MTDTLTPEQRHKCMSHIRSKNTKPELIVRKYLHACKIRFRINVKALPGTPDIVLRKYKTVILINGCFWHAHPGCKYNKLPQKNIKYWKAKIETNKKRDLKNYFLLRKLGWHIIVIWECQLKQNKKKLP